MTLKMKHNDLMPYLTQTDEGKKLHVNGLGTLNVIMAESKVIKLNSKVDDSLNINNIVQDNTKYIDKCISSLIKQVEILNQQVDDLRVENSRIKEINEKLTLQLIRSKDNHILLLESKNNKKSWIQELFNKGDKNE